LPINRAHIDRDARRDKAGEQPQDCREFALTRHTRRLGQMRALAEDLADHARARTAGADLHEHTDAVAIRLFDHCREIDRLQRLGDDRFGGAFARQFVAST